MSKSAGYKICNRCVMDTSARDISFDENGYCNYCREFLEEYDSFLRKDSTELVSERKELIRKIKESGRGKKYDCIVGVSGGADSSWALVKAVEAGLRPLAVHMDNGWNSELAQNNIEALVRNLDVDLFTYVIDWEEYRDLQKAFFNADVVDIELLYDNALIGVNYNQASEYSLRYILSGSNTATEGVRMPPSWAVSNKRDFKNIKSIWKKCGKGYPLKTFPGYSISQYLFDNHIRNIKWTRFLDYYQYDKSQAVSELENDFGYQPYLYKHYESVFTRFYQGYILPEKFGIDKRRNHLSALILTDQLTRSEALEKLEDIPYQNQDMLENDIQYFLKKFGWEREDLQEYIDRPRMEHEKYGSELYIMDWAEKLSPIVKPLINRINN